MTFALRSTAGTRTFFPAGGAWRAHTNTRGVYFLEKPMRPPPLHRRVREVSRALASAPGSTDQPSYAIVLLPIPLSARARKANWRCLQLPI